MSGTKYPRERILILSSFALKLQYQFYCDPCDVFWLPDAKSFPTVYYMNDFAAIISSRYYTLSLYYQLKYQKSKTPVRSIHLTYWGLSLFGGHGPGNYVKSHGVSYTPLAQGWDREMVGTSLLSVLWQVGKHLSHHSSVVRMGCGPKTFSVS